MAQAVCFARMCLTAPVFSKWPAGRRNASGSVLPALQMSDKDRADSRRAFIVIVMVFWPARAFWNFGKKPCVYQILHGKLIVTATLNFVVDAVGKI